MIKLCINLENVFENEFLDKYLRIENIDNSRFYKRYYWSDTHDLFC